MPATFAEAKLPISEVIGNGVTIDDPRIAVRVNEATQRLMSEGLWVGGVVDALICTSKQCFSLPRELENVMDFYLPDARVDVLNGWYQIENPSTYVDPDFLNDIVLVDLGEHPTLFDVCGPKLLKIYSDTGEDASLSVRIFGYDANTKEVYTIQKGVNAKGELVSLNGALAGILTVNSYNQINAIQKPITAGPLRLYSVDPNTSLETLLAILAPDETVPSYRRYFCNDIPLNADGSPVRIRVTGRRRFAHINSDSDFLLIPNIAALKLEVLAIERELESDLQGAQMFHQQAIGILKAEAKNYQLDPVRSSTRKAQYLLDEQSYDPQQLGYIRAKMALELPNLLKVGLRTITRLINEAQDRLIDAAHWTATVSQFNLRIYEDGFIVLPSFVESILTANLGRHPLVIRNQWFESAQNGPGVTDNMSYSGINLVDRGYGPTFFDLTESSEIFVSSSSTLDAALSVTIIGQDDAGNDASETVPMGTGGGVNFSHITRVEKPVTTGYVTLQSVDHYALAIIQPSDLAPTYHRYFIPGLGDNYDPLTVLNVQAKLKAVPVHMPSDFLTINSYTALKTMVQCIALENSADPQVEKAAALEAKALGTLKQQLRNSRGGAAQQINVQTRGYGTRRIIQPR